MKKSRMASGALGGILGTVLVLAIAMASMEAAEVNAPQREFSFGGMAFLAHGQAPSDMWAHASVSFRTRSTGWQADVFIAEPRSSFIEGSFIFNPFYDSPLSPTLRVGGVASLTGTMVLDLAAGFRWRLLGKFGFRAEYHLWNPLATREMSSISMGFIFGW